MKFSKTSLAVTAALAGLVGGTAARAAQPISQVSPAYSLGMAADDKIQDKIPKYSAGQCAGINRHMVGDERALQERNSETILASSFALAIVR